MKTTLTFLKLMVMVNGAGQAFQPARHHLPGNNNRPFTPGAGLPGAGNRLPGNQNNVITDRDGNIFKKNTGASDWQKRDNKSRDWKPATGDPVQSFYFSSSTIIYNMETVVTILNGISDTEKGAYLAAIASIATADTQASQLEIDHLTHLCEAAQLSTAQQQVVLQAATSTSEQELIKSLDILKNSDLKYALVTDLFAFAKSDGNYSEAEQQSVSKISTYLGIDQTQFGLLGELAEKTHNTSNLADEAQKPGFLSALGLGDKLQASGINGSSLLKGLVSVAAPIIISRMMGRNRSAGGGLLGNLAGGTLGGNSGGGLMSGGGLGSLIGMLSGGKGMGAAGGLLGKIFG